MTANVQSERDCHLAFTFVFVMQNKKTRKSSLTAVERGFRLCVDTASTPGPAYNELLLTTTFAKNLLVQ